MENPRPQISRTNPSSTFRLPADLVIHVLRFLDPIDILSMRKTCTMIHRTTKARIVWLVALERICETHGIFKPTFPTNRMSRLELEHAALSPHRFIKSIKAGENADPARPYQNRNIPCRKRAGPNSNEIHRANSIFLIPGGRFLLTSDRLRRSGVCLWDLGYNANVPIKPFPIAMLDLSGASLESVAPSGSCRELLLAININLNLRLDNAPMLRIYRVDPENASKGFQMEGQLEIDSETIVGSFLCSDVIYLVHRGYLIIWNWINNTGCKWYSDSFWSVDPLAVYASKQSIISYDRGDNIRVWDIPALVSVTKPNFTSFHSVYNPQKHSIPHLLTDDTVGIIFSGTSTWQQQSTSTLHLLRLVEYETEVEDYNFIVYSLRDTEKLDDPFLPRLLPVTAGRSKFIHGEEHPTMFRGPVSSLFNCDNHLVFCTGSESGPDMFDRKNVAVALEIPERYSEDYINLHPMTLIHLDRGTDDDNDINSYQFGFCPMSGRLVYLLTEGIEPEVRLADYLLPPEEPSHQESS